MSHFVIFTDDGRGLTLVRREPGIAKVFPTRHDANCAVDDLADAANPEVRPRYFVGEVLRCLPVPK